MVITYIHFPVLPSARIGTVYGKSDVSWRYGNLARTGTTLDKSKMKTARKAFRKMKNIDGQQITLKPYHVFVGTDLDVEAQTLLQSITSSATLADVIPQALKSIVPVYGSREQLHMKERRG